jgi:chorismate-pyruvate lyase
MTRRLEAGLDEYVGKDFSWFAAMTLDVRKAAFACGIVTLWWTTAGADDATSEQSQNWSASFVARLEALALLETLNAQLLSNNSATLTLEHWCDVHHLASPPRIAAERVHDVDKPASPEQRRELDVTPTEPVRYRRVRLKCGPVVLSEADNWYVPSRLTPEMNRFLETTDMPFGKVVQALHFQRHTLSAKVLWFPLPDGWEMNAANAKNVAVVPMPTRLLEHRAVLTLPDGIPFSEVVESYTADVLAFPVPQP